MKKTSILVLAVAVLEALLLLASRGSAQGRSMITLDDLIWTGLYSFPRDGENASPNGPGTNNYASGALAVRYVNGQRRYLVPTFTTANAQGRQWGDLVEYRDPSGSTYSGSTPGQAAALVEVGRWANWTAYDSTPSWQDADSGARIGGLYWDSLRGVLWYQLYGYYQSRNTPLLGATQLLETATTGNYRAVGAKYGPWWYRSNSASDGNLYWKAVNYWLVPVPASAQEDFGGRKFIIGGSVGAVGSLGNLGPGSYAIPDLPSLSEPPNSVIPAGLALADYTSKSTQSPPHARRDANYLFRPQPAETPGGYPLDSNGTGLWPPSGGRGFWQMSLDQVNSFCWVETPAKHGILMFGRIAHGDTWYGWNPRWATPGNLHDPPDSIDPTRSLNPPDSNGYGATVWNAALYAFDPAQVRQVATGARSPYSDGINPILLGDWHAKWPNLPMNKDNLGGTGVSPPISQSISNTCYWDAQAAQLIWVQPMSVDLSSPRPTINFFTVAGATTVPTAPAAPTNVRIIIR